MEISIHISSALRRFVDGQATVQVTGNTVTDALAELRSKYPALAENIYTSSGEMRSFIRGFLNQKDLRFCDMDTLQLTATDIITLMSAIAGG